MSNYLNISNLCLFFIVYYEFFGLRYFSPLRSTAVTTWTTVTSSFPIFRMKSFPLFLAALSKFRLPLLLSASSNSSHSTSEDNCSGTNSFSELQYLMPPVEACLDAYSDLFCYLFYRHALLHTAQIRLLF